MSYDFGRGGGHAVRRLLSACLVCIMLLGMLPSGASANTPLCGIEEHAHSQECYAVYDGRELACEYEARYVHRHDDACYDADGNLTCMTADFVLHKHDENCYDSDGGLVCTMEERDESVHGLADYDSVDAACVWQPYFAHVHGPECYRTEKILTCELEETPDAHRHGPECYEKQLTCGIEILDDVPETEAGDGESAAGTVENPGDAVASDGVVLETGADGTGESGESFEPGEPCESGDGDGDGGPVEAPLLHEHTASCYTDVLVCDLAETGHVHDDSCYETRQVLDCKYVEDGNPDAGSGGMPVCVHYTYEEHVHDSSCYDGQGRVMCGKWELKSHQHNETCFKAVVGSYGDELTCGKQEHAHGPTCYDDKDGFLAGCRELTADFRAWLDTEPDEAGSSEALSGFKPRFDGLLEQAGTFCDETRQDEAVILAIAELRAVYDAYFADAGNTLGTGAGPGVITVGGTEFDKALFMPMSDYLTKALLYSPAGDESNCYDLMGGGNFTVNVFQDFDAEMQFVFTTSSDSGLNKYYYFNFNGARLDEPISGSLTDEAGRVFGDYVIDTDGSVYVVLNDLGLSQSYIDWRLKFMASWDTSGGDDLDLDLGNSLSVNIKFDRTRFAISKSCYPCDVGSLSHFGYYGQFDYEVTVTALDNIALDRLHDVVRPSGSSSDMMFAQVLASTGKTFADLISFDGFRVEVLGADGSVLRTLADSEYEILNVPGTWTDGTETDDIDVLLHGMELQSGQKLRFSYRMTCDEDLMLAIMQDRESYVCIKNECDGILSTGESIRAASPLAEMHYDDVIKKECDFTKYASEGVARWEVRCYPSDGIDFSDAYILDELTDSRLAYDLTAHSWYIRVYWPDSMGGYKEYRIQPTVCQSAEEFDHLSYELNGQGIYVYGNRFKAFSDDMAGDDAKYINQVIVRYYTNWDESIGTDLAAMNVASVIAPDWRFGTEGHRGVGVSKSNDGVHYDAQGQAYTNWTVRVYIPFGVSPSGCRIYDYWPRNGDYSLFDTPIGLEDVRDGDWRDYGSAGDFMAATGFTLTFVDSDNNDLSSQIAACGIEDETGRVLDTGAPRPRFKFYVGDSSHANRSARKGGFDAVDYDRYLTLTFPMRLAGDVNTFQTHKNEAYLYWDYYLTNELRVSSTLDLSSAVSSTSLEKVLTSQSFSDDGSVADLSYRVEYGLDNGTLVGSSFEDTMGSSYVSYVPGSLRAYLKSSDGSLASVASGSFVGLSETEAGFSTGLDLSGYDLSDCESVVFEYDAAADIAAMVRAGVFVLDVTNMFAVRDASGDAMRVVRTTNQVFSGSIRKNLLVMPESTNAYRARYEIVVDTADPSLAGLQRLDIVDEMSPSMSILPDTVNVESGDSLDVLSAAGADGYGLLLDGEENKLTCSVDRTVVTGRYVRVMYDVLVSGAFNSTVSCSNKAYIAGFRNQAVEDIQDIFIQSSTGSVDADRARILISKYDSDDVRTSLPGAEFVLYGLNTPSEVDLVALRGMSSKQEVIDYFGPEHWTELVRSTTGADGMIEWRHDPDTLPLPLNSLYKVSEVSAPDGYVLPADPDQYFYLAIDNGEAGSRSIYLKYFDAKNFDTTLFVGNRKGAFNLRKTDAETGEVLFGARFGLYSDAACTDLISNGVVDMDGDYYFGNLRIGGVYYLKELEAPEGYVTGQGTYLVQVQDDGSVSVRDTETMDPLELSADGRVLFPNAQEAAGGPKLPSTGGCGVMRYWGYGVSLLALAMLVMLNRPGKNRRKLT